MIYSISDTFDSYSMRLYIRQVSISYFVFPIIAYMDISNSYTRHGKK